MQKKNVEKHGARIDFLQKTKENTTKITSDLDHEFAPNSPPRGHDSNLGTKGARKEPKGAKRLPKDSKSSQKGAKRIPKSCENQ